MLVDALALPPALLHEPPIWRVNRVVHVEGATLCHLCRVAVETRRGREGERLQKQRAAWGVRRAVWRD